MSRNDETDHIDPGTRVTVNASWHKTVHGKAGTVTRWDDSKKLYSVQLDGWRAELVFHSRELDEQANEGEAGKDGAE